MGARSFDAPRRAGTVTTQDSTAASSRGGSACGAEMGVRWESVREARIGAVERSYAGFGARVVATAATGAVSESGNHTMPWQGESLTRCQEGRLCAYPYNRWRASTRANRRRLKESRRLFARLAGAAQCAVSALAQHGAGCVVGDNDRRIGEEGEEEQFASVRQRERRAGTLPPTYLWATNRAPSTGDCTWTST